MLIKETSSAGLPIPRAGFLTNAGALYIGAAVDATTHAAHAYKVYVALRGEFQVFMGNSLNGCWCRAIIVAPDQYHRIDGGQAVIALFYLVPETPQGQRISKLLRGQMLSNPSAGTIAELLPRLRRYLDMGCDVEEATEASEYLFDNLISGCQGVKTLFEPRVMGVLEYLDHNLEQRVTIAELASVVKLSASRLEHLFADEVGIPISRYLLSLRVRAALKLMAVGHPLTRVAHDVGFSDSAHLSRTFRRMIGIAPSYLMKNVPLLSASSGEV